MKTILFNTLLKALSMIDKGQLTKCVLSQNLIIEYSKYIPNDKKWHHYTHSVDMWAKKKGGEIEKNAELKIYLNGKEVLYAKLSD